MREHSAAKPPAPVVPPSEAAEKLGALVGEALDVMHRIMTRREPRSEARAGEWRSLMALKRETAADVLRIAVRLGDDSLRKRQKGKLAELMEAVEQVMKERGAPAGESNDEEA